MSIIYGNLFTWCSLLFVLIFIVLNFVNKKSINFICIGIGSILSIYGLLCSFTFPSFFFKKLTSSPRVDKQFINWASEQFDSFAHISTIITICILLIFILALLLSKRNNNISEWYIFLTIITQICLIVIAFMVGLNTINKRFDVAGYILGMGYYNALTLFGIYVFYKIYNKK